MPALPTRRGVILFASLLMLALATATWALRARAQSAQTLYCRRDAVTIPDNGRTSDVLSITDNGTIQDLNLELNVDHSRVGDLTVALRKVETRNGVAILWRAGVPDSQYGCLGDNVAAVFDDEASVVAETACDDTAPALSGDLQPWGRLGNLDGETLAGTWQLDVIDEAQGESGTLTGWCLEADLEGGSVTASPPTATATATPIVPTPTNTPIQATPTSTSTPPPTATSTTSPPTSTPMAQDGMVVDHTSVALFEQIPEQYLDAAANLRMLFIDRSVGGNIDDGLTCLGYPSDEEAPNHCVRYEHPVPAYSVDPSEVSWSRPGGYDRSNWDYRYWDGDCSYWSDKLDCFFNMTAPVLNQYDVVSFQYSYLSVDESSTIADQPGGYFWDNATYSDVYDQEAYEAQHANKVFIYWTTSLARGIGTDVATDFNNQMRAYAVAHDKPLFDVADILSHTPDGQPCYDNRDGVVYDPRPDDPDNPVENYPDDGVNQPAICQEYTTETDGGHLGSVSAGKIRVAKAFWVLMARIAGWDVSP